MNDVFDINRNRKKPLAPKKQREPFFCPNKDGEMQKLSIDGKLRDVLDTAKKRQNDNWDYCLIICGRVGCGKSVVGKMIMKYMQPEATVDNIVFNADEWVDKTVKEGDKSAVVLDETHDAMNSGNVLNPEQRKVVTHLNLIRKRGHCLVLILPDMFDLPKNVVLFRTSGLIYVHEDDDGKRGCFRYYGNKEKKKLFLKGKKWIDYDATPASFIGRFYQNKDIIDDEEYERRKDQHLADQSKHSEDSKAKKLERDLIMWRLYTEYNWKYKEIAKLYDLTEDWVGKVMSKIKKGFKNQPKPPND